ncbi:MAG: GYF domain-containing protein [Myxococcota bacterium]|nr:GYF domain-containing protein [Myxococcota bacterium]
MKIVCGNCSAKYSIADEKVKGKVFKIRCKKCGESIVVRGEVEKPVHEASPEPAEEATFSPPPMPEQEPAEADDGNVETKVFDYSGYQDGAAEDFPQWHIVVEGQQQGPYTGAQIREYLDAGSLDLESYVWKEGFEDWLPIRSVPEFGGDVEQGDEQPLSAAEPSASPASVAGGGLFDTQSQALSSGGLFDQPAEGGLFGGADTAAEPDPAASPFDAGGGLFGTDQAGAGDQDVFSSAALDAPTSGGLFSQPASQDTAGNVFATPQDGQQEPDIFGDVAGDTDGGSLFSSVDEANQAPPFGDQAAMTGQRNENSVLFSLSNLQALAAGTTGTDMAALPDPAVGQDVGAPTAEEASGLIDIRSLASSLTTDKESAGVDDLLSLGADGFAPALGAPVLAPQAEGLSTRAIVGIIAGGVAVLAVVVVLLVVAMSDDDEATRIAELQAQIQKLQQSTTVDTPQIQKLRDQLAEAQQSAGQPSEAPSKKAPAPSEKKAVDKNPEPKTSPSSTSTSTKRSSSRPSSRKTKSSSSKSSPSSSSSSSSKSKSDDSLFRTKETKSASSTTKTSPSRGKDELDDLLGGSVSKSSQKKRSSSSGSSKPASGGGGAVKASLDRADVQKGMNGVAGRVKQCGQGSQGTVTLKVVIGSTGRVISAVATGPFAGTPVGSCAARAVRGARFPKSQQNLTVRYPFKL